jgi:type I restriction enzyme R subunit
MQTYDALADFAPADVDLSDAVIDTHEEVGKLPQRHSDLWAVFKQVANKQDTEALEQHLAPEDQRQDFYQALRGYQQALAVALSTEHFFADTPPDKVQHYKDDLKFFVSLRHSVQQRYSETIDYGQYEKQIRKVMDDHIQAPDVAVITEMVNIFDQQAFDAEVERLEGVAAKADTIASRMAKTITEKMDQDPVFYTRFAELVQRAIDDYRRQRIDELEYLKRISEYLETVRRGHESDVPEELRDHRAAQAYFGVIGEVLERYPVAGVAERDVTDDHDTDSQAGLAARMALAIEAIIDERRIRDWVHNEDIQRRMKDAIDDYLFDMQDKQRLRLQTGDMDGIIDRCLDIARKQAGG